MDPVTAIQLVSSINEIIRVVYIYAKGVKDASNEIKRLSSELFGLKAALEHISWDLNVGFGQLSLKSDGSRISADGERQPDEPLVKRRKGEIDTFPGSSPVDSIDSISTLTEEPPAYTPFSPLLETEETRRTFEEADKLLNRLSKTLGKPSAGKVSQWMQRASWPMKKGETAKMADHLERIKTYFVLATTTDSLSYCKQIYREIISIRNIFEEQTAQKMHGDKRQVTARWLSPCDPFSFQERTIANRHKNTGRWFLEGDFDFWLRGSLEARVLWMRGKPGSGKTTLFASCVDRLQKLKEQQSGAFDFAFFFCTATETPSQQIENILGSLATQFCDLEPSAWPIFEQYRESRMKQSGNQLKKAEQNALEDMLIQICDRFSNVLLLLDAANESVAPDWTLQSLYRVLERSKNARLLLTSTEDTDILKSPFCPLRIISMNRDSVQGDIQSFVEARIGDSETLRRLSDGLKQEVIDSLVLRADGSFRWVSCQIDTISQERSPRSIRKALMSVPSTLEETYVAILCGIPPRDRELAKAFLRWLTFSQRSLFLEELAEAAVLTDEHPCLEPDARLFEINSILSRLRSLIRVDRTADSVGLAHDSVFTFLTSQTIRDSPAAAFYLDPLESYTDLAAKCIAYLTLPAFESGYCSEAELDERFREWPLLDYAAQLWTLHVKRLMEVNGGELPDIIHRNFRTFVQSEDTCQQGRNFAAWYQAVFPEAEEEPEIWLTPPLYTVAREGLVPLMQDILSYEGTKNLETLGGRNHSTPLHVAATYGQVEAVKALLAAGANPNESNPDGVCGLNFAALYGHMEVVEILLDAGANPRRITHGEAEPIIFIRQDGKFFNELQPFDEDWQNLMHDALWRLLAKHSETRAKTDDHIPRFSPRRPFDYDRGLKMISSRRSPSPLSDSATRP